MTRYALSALLLLATACAGAPPSSGGGDPFGSQDRPDYIVLEVQNLNFSDARLYVLRDGQRISLGTVTGKQDGTFRVPWTLQQEVRIEINLLAGPSCVTDRLHVDRGDILDLQIPSTFSSMAACR